MGDKFVKTDDDYLERYQTDEEGNSHYFHKPEVVVFPGSTEEVAEVVKLANKYLVPITPRSAGSGVACGAIPVYHGIVVELERMNQILTFDADNMYAVCQTGVITGDLQREAAKHGLLYAGDPSSADSSMIGGNVANNAGGNKAVKYGTTRNQIYSLKVVTPTGDILDAGARLKKCSTGLCLEQLFAGSEGVLGIITEVTVKLLPKPQVAKVLMASFDSVEKAGRAVGNIIAAGIIPGGLEMMDNLSIRAVEDFIHAGYPVDAEAILLCELDGVEADVQDDCDRVKEVLETAGATEVRLARDEAERVKFWAGRKNAFPLGRRCPGRAR